MHRWGTRSQDGTTGGARRFDVSVCRVTLHVQRISSQSLHVESRSRGTGWDGSTASRYGPLRRRSEMDGRVQTHGRTLRDRMSLLRRRPRRRCPQPIRLCAKRSHQEDGPAPESHGPVPSPLRRDPAPLPQHPPTLPPRLHPTLSEVGRARGTGPVNSRHTTSHRIPEFSACQSRRGSWCSRRGRRSARRCPRRRWDSASSSGASRGWWRRRCR